MDNTAFTPTQLEQMRQIIAETVKSSLSSIKRAPVQINKVPIPEAASILGISRETVYRWVREGKLEMVKTKTGNKITLKSIENSQNLK